MLQWTKVSILTRSEERVQRRLCRHLYSSIQVSILTRSEERVQPWAFRAPYTQRRVSILTRSEERVQLEGKEFKFIETEFQSSPAPKSGCNPAT